MNITGFFCAKNKYYYVITINLRKMVFFNSFIKYGKDRHHPIVFAFRTADILIKLFGSVIRLLNLFHKIFGFYDYSCSRTIIYHYILTDVGIPLFLNEEKVYNRTIIFTINHIRYTWNNYCKHLDRIIMIMQ